MSAPVFVSTSCVQKSSSNLESLLNDYLTASLNYIELGWAPSPKSEDLTAHLEACEAEFLIHNYFPEPLEQFVLNLAAQESHLLQRSLLLCERAINLSVRLKAPFYSVHAGFRVNLAPGSLGKPIEYEQIFPYDIAYQTFVRSIQKLVDLGRGRSVGILVEPNVLQRYNLVQDHNELALICEGWEVLNMVRDVNDPGLGIILDTGHLNVTSQTLAFDRMSFVEQIAPYVRAFHVHDNDGTADTHQPVQPGSWILDVLRRPDFVNLPIIVEANFNTVADLYRHVEWLKEELGRE
jgi:sugar phosphate isomerase/epimerase